MKKKYQKPKIAIESFTLAEVIASCDLNTNNNADWDEEWRRSGFFSDSSCGEQVSEGTALNGYCYFTSSGITVFAS